MNECLSSQTIIVNDVKIIGLSNINENNCIHNLVYKIHNIINGKYYIGRHKTCNPLDTYMGSGLVIQEAEKKYGMSAFIKEILFDLSSFDEMVQKEIDLVQLSDCYPYNPLSYNISPGGNGGNTIRWDIEECKQDQIAKRKLARANRTKEQIEIEHKNRIEGAKRGYKNAIKNDKDHFKRSDKFKKNLSDMRTGENNPMYGKNSQDYMTPEAIEEKCKKEREAQLGRKRMKNISTGEVRHVKPQDFEKFLTAGFIFTALNFHK